jgi:hypothetical protein
MEGYCISGIYYLGYGTSQLTHLNPPNKQNYKSLFVNKVTEHRATDIEILPRTLTENM